MQKSPSLQTSQKSLSRPIWIIAGFVAAIILGVASNLIADDLKPIVERHPFWVWFVFAITVIVGIAAAFVDAWSNLHSTVPDAQPAINPHIAAENTHALHQLRAPVGDFKGREQEIETLLDALRPGSRACIISISGMGGIGKTELALYVAELVLGHYPDAQFFINLRGTDTNPRRPPQEVLATCIRAFLGPEARLPEDLDQLRQLYLGQLRGKRVLLLLDNADDEEQVQPLLPPTGSALLVTSREVIPLPAMTLLRLDSLTDREAQDLLMAIAKRVDPAAAKQICELCGNLPLAIRAAGSLLAITSNLDPNEYAAQLKDQRNPIQYIGTRGVEIGVEASFNLSFLRLEEETARVFCWLSVFPGTFDAAAEEVVCADPGHTHLTELVRRSLVMYDENTNRYRLHDLARLFADAKLQPETRIAAQKRHAEYFLTKGETVEEQLGDTGLRKHMEWFKTEQDNMQAAASRSLENDPAMALRFAYILSGFMNILGQLKEERKALNDALEAGKDAPPKLQMRVLGRAAVRQSDLEFANSLAERHLELSRLAQDDWEECWAWQNLGNIAQAQGRLKDAREFQNNALRLFEQLENKLGMAMTHLNLCLISLDEEDLVSARTSVTKSLPLSEEVRHRGYVAIARSYLAFVLHKEGNEAEAKALINESVEMLRSDERQSWLPWGLHWQGRIAIGRGDFETAHSALTDSLTLFQRNEDSYGQIRSLLAFSWLNAAEGHWERAATLLAAEESQRTKQQSPAAPDWRREIEFIKDRLQQNLAAARYAKASEKGRQMSLDQAVAYAMDSHADKRQSPIDLFLNPVRTVFGKLARSSS